MHRLPDYHTHTARCGHATGRPSEYVDAAHKAGLLAIGVADHLPLLPSHEPGLTMQACELDDYVEEVRTLKEQHPDYVLLGIEADYRRETLQDVSALLSERSFDYVIGSVHFIDGWGFDDPRHTREYEQRDIHDIWIDYLELVGEAAECGLFTILGHLDLIKKFGYRPTRSLERELDRLVDRVARSGVLVEINTAGLHRPAEEAYPSLSLLRSLHEAEVSITFGSDAHRPEEVGRDFAHAAALARAAGYETFAALEPMSPSSVPPATDATDSSTGGVTAGLEVREMPLPHVPPLQEDRS